MSLTSTMHEFRGVDFEMHAGLSWSAHELGELLECMDNDFRQSLVKAGPEDGKHFVELADTLKAGWLLNVHYRMVHRSDELADQLGVPRGTQELLLLEAGLLDALAKRGGLASHVVLGFVVADVLPLFRKQP